MGSLYAAQTTIQPIHPFEISFAAWNWAAVDILFPVEGERLNLVMPPCNNGIYRSLPPVEGLVVFVVRRAIDKDAEPLAVRLNESISYTISNQVAERVVIGQDIEQNYGCKG